MATQTESEKLATLNALTGSVATVNFLNLPTPALTPSTPAPSLPAANKEATNEVAATTSSLPVTEEKPNKQKGKKIADPAGNSPTPTALAVVVPVAAVAESELLEEVPAGAETADETSFSVGEGSTVNKIDYANFFAKNPTKKEKISRLSAHHHDFLQQASMLIGNNAPLTDIVDNIITAWRAQYESMLVKEMQKAWRRKTFKS